MELTFPLAILALFLASSIVVDTSLLIATPTENCQTSTITSNSTFCCDGVCIDQTEIGQTGACLNWADQCQVAPKCANTQMGSAKNQTPVDSGDGCCYLCGLNPQGCQWQRFQWTYQCCDCPAGYVAGSGGECGIVDGSCYACDGDSEVLTKNGTKWECQSSGSSTSKPSTILGSASSSVGVQSTPASSKPTAGATSNTDSNNTASVESTSKNGLSTGTKVGIGVGVPLAVLALAALLALLWKTGMLSGIIGSTSAGASGGGAAESSMISATQAMQTASAAKPLLMSSNSTAPSVFGAIAGAAAASSAATMTANSANSTNAANSSNTGNTIDPTHASNAASSPSDPSASVGSTAAGASPGDAGMSSVGAGPSAPSANIGATAASPSGAEGTSTIGQTGSSGLGAGSHHTGVVPGFFGALGLRRKKSKDKKDKRPALAAVGSSQQPLVGELDGGRNKLGLGDKKHESAGQEIRGHEISGDQIHEADESTVSEIDSTSRHELK